MKVNNNSLVTKIAVSISVFYCILFFTFAFAPVGAKTSDQYTIRCVSISEDGSLNTVYEKDGIKNVKISEKDGHIVYTLVFDKTGHTYDMVLVEKNVGCIVDATRSFN